MVGNIQDEFALNYFTQDSCATVLQLCAKLADLNFAAACSIQDMYIGLNILHKRSCDALM